MSYCRFQNTYRDLLDCYLHIDEEVNNVDERQNKKHLIKLCIKIAEEFRDEEDK